jgi:hypothetical protein
VFLLLIVAAGRSRVLVRRKLMARALVGAAAPDRDRGDAARPRMGDVYGGSLWLVRRLVLTEVIIAVAILAITALLGIATQPQAGLRFPLGNEGARVVALISSAPTCSPTGRPGCWWAQKP